MQCISAGRCAGAGKGSWLEGACLAHVIWGSIPRGTIPASGHLSHRGFGVGTEFDKPIAFSVRQVLKLFPFRLAYFVDLCKALFTKCACCISFGILAVGFNAII